MPATDQFTPSWASPPGETIRDALSEQRISRSEFAASLGVSADRASALLRGAEAITVAIARSLSRLIGGSIEFWITRDGQYRDDLKRVEVGHWTESLPVRQMIAFGWIEDSTDRNELIANSLRFFAVSDLNQWQHTYGSILATARFRSSDGSRINESVLLAWLRRAEVEAKRIECSNWNAKRLVDAIPELRKLTRVSDPRRFIPTLVNTCAETGVAVVILRPPSGCAVSGVTRYLDANSPHIILSGRYLADDQFWFTFFHEVGHLLLHEPNEVFVDEFNLEDALPMNNQELEADRFAADVLISRTVREELMGQRPSAISIHQIAKKAGVSPGIVVGQLQHNGIVGFNSVFNQLKRRYKWVSTTLEKA